MFFGQRLVFLLEKDKVYVQVKGFMDVQIQVLGGVDVL
jgi:hypothetical protein